MKKIIFLFFWIYVADLNAQVSRKICISVDDLPFVSYGIKKNDHEWIITNGILDAFEKHDAPAIGFVNSGKLFTEGKPDTSRMGHITEWLKRGFDIGNHTYAHKNYHKVSFEEFTQDILDGEKVVKEIVESYGKQFDYFRHPYLRSGEDESETERLSQFLNENGYKESFVTVDDDDYLFALAYSRAYRKDDSELMEKIGESYLTYMKEKLMYFENCSIELFGRNINHTVLIHANFINARYLDQLLTIYEDLGYSFISQEEAASDPAYHTPVTKFGNWGISWIHKWGMSAGKDNSFFKDDPRTPEFVMELSR